MSALWSAIRRSSARFVLPGIIGIVLLHVFGRSRAWEHEWVWAFYQFNFITVMLGPIVAGIGAWEVQRYAKARWLFDGSNKRFAPVAQMWAAVMAWVLASYLAGIVLVAVLVLASGTPSLPDGRTWALLLPALALLGAEVALGVVLGWYIASPLVSPAVAVGVFLLSLFLYTQGPGALIIVGGATSSMFGNMPKASLQWAQVVGYAAVTLACLSVAAWWGGGRSRSRRTLAVGSVALAVGGVGLIVAQGSNLFAPYEEDVACYGQDPQVCGGPGYANGLPQAHDTLQPYIALLSEQGITVPDRFMQGEEPGTITVGPLSAPFLSGETGDAPVLVVNTYLSKSCDFGAHPDVLDTVFVLQSWLAEQVGDADFAEDQYPPALTDGTDAERRAWMENAVDAVKRCR